MKESMMSTSKSATGSTTQDLSNIFNDFLSSTGLSQMDMGNLELPDLLNSGIIQKLLETLQYRYDDKTDTFSLSFTPTFDKEKLISQKIGENIVYTYEAPSTPVFLKVKHAKEIASDGSINELLKQVPDPIRDYLMLFLDLS